MNGVPQAATILRGTNFAWRNASTTISLSAQDLLVYGLKEGDYIRWYVYYQPSSSYSSTFPANGYYYLVHNVSAAQTFGTYEEDEIGDSIASITPGNTGFPWTGGLYIQSTHIDDTTFPNFFN